MAGRKQGGSAFNQEEVLKAFTDCYTALGDQRDESFADEWAKEFATYFEKMYPVQAGTKKRKKKKPAKESVALPSFKARCVVPTSFAEV